jgi:hypothetical protein
MDGQAAAGGVIKPTPKLANGSAAPRPASSLTKPTAASAAKSAAKVATPRAAASAAKPTPKATPVSAVSKADRASLDGRTPTATMTCRVEALDMLAQGEATPNASSDKSSEMEMETSQHSAGTHSDANPFGSPAAAMAPQVRRSYPSCQRQLPAARAYHSKQCCCGGADLNSALQVTSTIVFSATKLVPDLTGTSVLAAKSPKLRTPPGSNTSKIKVASCSCAGATSGAASSVACACAYIEVRSRLMRGVCGDRGCSRRPTRSTSAGACAL